MFSKYLNITSSEIEIYFKKIFVSFTSRKGLGRIY